MLRLCFVLLLAFSFACAQAEDLPLGLVSSNEDAYVEATFNAAHGVLPDDMVAIYGPGTVVKHPLTQQVETEHRKLVAKAHVVSVADKTLRAKIVFVEDGAKVAVGYDVVPMPGEASPDAPPILEHDVDPIEVQAQQTVALSAPIKDPEGKPIAIRWSLKGTYGHVGRLSTQSSGMPVIDWTAPGLPGSGTIVAVATDPLGQSITVEMPFTVKPLGDDFRQRELKPFAQFGGNSGVAYGNIAQADNGLYWAIDADGRSIYEVPAGWSLPNSLNVASDANMRQPSSLHPFGRELFVLDTSARSVLVLAAGGQLQRQFVGLKSPSDLSIDSKGAVYVADQQAGGVQVFEKDGSFRLCLGRAGEGIDSFKDVTHVCIDDNDTCYALDADQRMIMRYNKFHQRLDTWTIQGDPQIKLLDIAPHPLGLLILQSNGQVLVHTERGISGSAMPSPIDSGLVERLGEPSSLFVERGGRIYVSYPKDDILVRYNKQGQLHGVRGPDLWDYDQLVVDGKAWSYGLDERSGYIYAHDDEGWRMYRFGGMERNGGVFERPALMAVAFDGSALCVSDERRYTIERFNLKDQGKSKIAFGQRGKNNGQFEDISAICMDNAGYTYVADERNHRVSVFNEEGNFLYQFGTYERGRTASEIVRPQFIAVNAEGTVCYIYDSKKYEIQKFELNLKDGMAQHVTNAGGRGKAMGQVSRPVGLACDRAGLLYLLDSGRRDLQVLDFRGNNAVGIVAVPMSDYDMSSVDTLAVNPDGMPTVGARGAFMSFRWER